MVDYQTNFEKSLPLEDLETDPTFVKSLYVAGGVDVALDVQLVRFVEFGYSFNKTNTEDFGLYIYLFVNKENQIIDSVQNEVNLSVKNDENGVSYDYLDYHLTLISTDGNFYKFKIQDKDNVIINSLEDEGRTYTVASVDLRIKDEGDYKYNAKAFGIGGKWTFTGYAKGYGEDKKESTLTCSSATDYLTIKLDVGHTNFLTSSSKGTKYKNNINSVYFSVPNDILEEYGALQKIKAEWYEYKTTPIIFTADDSRDDYDANYEELNNWIGVKVNSFNRPERSFYENAYPGGPEIPNALGGYIYNIFESDYDESNKEDLTSTKEINPLTYLFAVKNLSGLVLKNTELKDYVNSFYEKYKDRGVQLSEDEYLNKRGIAEGLFEDYVDEGRTIGHNVKTFDIGDSFNVLDYDSSHEPWQRFWDYFGHWGATTDDGLDNVAPIYEVKELTKAKDLLIHDVDYYDFVSYYTLSKAKNTTTFLFRFDQTDYYSSNLNCRKDIWGYPTQNMAYATQTAFLDFDILELTFNKEGVETVFGCVMDPQDVYSHVELPQGCADYGAYTRVILFLGVVVVGYKLLDKHGRKR